LEGDIVKRPKFAETLRKIGQSGSADIFYKGSLGEKVVEEIQSQGGIITLEDLKKYK
jgi:gamma-glutamyltranspeptidase